MFKICYIHPSGSSLPSHWVMPAGVFGLADLIEREGIEVLGLNYPMELVINKNFSIKKWLLDNPCDCYIVGIHWFVHARGAVYLIRIIREVNPDAIIITGGLTAGLFYNELMESIPEINFLICGDGEKPLVELLKALNEKKTDYSKIPNLVFKENYQLAINKNKFILEDFNDIRYSNVNFLSNANKYFEFSYPGLLNGERAFWLSNGRGCKYNCICCGGSNEVNKLYFNKSGLVMRNVKMVLDDIENLNKWKLDEIKLTHDINSFGHNYYDEFMSEYSQKAYSMTLYNEFWQLPTRDFLATAEKYGLYNKLDLAITVHSGNEKLRKVYGKSYSNEEIMEVIKFCSSKGAFLRLFFSRYIYEDNYETLKETYKMINDIKSICNNGNLLICYEPIIVDPCSALINHKSKAEVFNEYLNLNNNNSKEFYMRMVNRLSSKQKVIEGKIIQAIET